LRSAYQRDDAGHEFRQVEGLDHVVVSAGLEAGKLVVQFITRGHHDQRRTFTMVFTKLSAQGQSVDSGQHDVEHDDIETTT